jgi:hypothetical protein
MGGQSKARGLNPIRLACEVKKSRYMSSKYVILRCILLRLGAKVAKYCSLATPDLDELITLIKTCCLNKFTVTEILF